MARQIEGPWFRGGKNAWYATVGGKSVSLGVKGKASRKQAREAWHKLMADGPKAEAKPKAQTVRQLVDDFLADAKGRIGEESWRGYRKFLEPFAQAHGRRPAEGVTAPEAEAFSRKPEWSATYRAGFLGTLSAAYRWAVRQRLIASNPVEGVRKPVRASRGTKAVVSEAEHGKLLAVADPVFGDFLRVLWATGARPGEVAGLTAEMVRASADGIIPLVAHKEAHKGKARFLILTADAWAVAKRRAEAVGGGLLFVGKYGPLTPKAITSKMHRLCEKAGIRVVMAYGYRHTFATTALAAGVADAQVAALLGHSGTAMLHRHYSHLTAQAQAMREALGRVRG